MSTVRTRFAPSPTGFMHVGGVRTALFAWLLARQNGGQFILRLEDTDQVREVAGSAEHIKESLQWLGLDWDEGFDKSGPYGPYRQSERLATYREWAQKLIDTGRAYADPYTKTELDSFRQQAQTEKRPFLYRDHRPRNPPEWDGSQPLRLLCDPIAYTWHDEVLGELHAGPEVIDDFVLMKPDGFPTYNFAHIIDDELMKVTHAIRSQEFISSVPKYLNLYDALHIERPKLAIVPFVMGPDGKKKLSKRDGAKDIMDYAREGYLPEALLNFMATLGWNDGTEQELFTVQELIKAFSLERVQRSGARFDERRLLWMNGAHIRRLSTDELFGRIDASFWPSAAASATESYKKSVLRSVQERIKFFAELTDLTAFFFERPTPDQVIQRMTSPTDKQLKNLDQSHFSAYLRAVSTELAESDFSVDDIQARLNTLLESLQTKPGILFSLVRIAVTGAAQSPQIFETLHVIGKTESLDRLWKAIEAVTDQFQTPKSS